MTKIFVEDIFLEFFDTLENGNVSFLKQDQSAAISFYNILITNQQLTQNQANYILRILEKYKNISISLGFDYSDAIAQPIWKQLFRVIDLSKEVFVEIDEDRCPWVCLKFPFQLKKDFENEILSDDVEGRDYGNVWDKDRKLRMLSLYEYNIIQIHDFVKKHNFHIDETFFDALASVEEIWQSQEHLQKRSRIENNKVVLVNASSDTSDWFEKNSNGNITNDLLLAKSMGYTFEGDRSNKIQKIASAKTNTFYTKSYTDLFGISSEIDGKICFILDRTVNALNWLKMLLTHIDSNNLKKEEFKVCFRESNKENPEFNDWVKENGFGGSVKDGKYLIFQHKPAKWLFNDTMSVKIIATNNLYPSTNQLTRSWILTHPCVIYLDETKPSNRRQDIVEL